MFFFIDIHGIESNRTTLVESGALEVLVGVLKDPENREKSHRYAAVSICELISGSGACDEDGYAGRYREHVRVQWTWINQMLSFRRYKAEASCTVRNLGAAHTVSRQGRACQ